MKKFLLWICAIAAALCLALYICGQIVTGDYAAEKLASALPAPAPRFQKAPVFTFFPPKLAFGRVEWRGRIGGMRVDFRAAGGELEGGFFSLLFGKPELGALSLYKPVLSLAPEPGAASSHTGAFSGFSRLLVQDGLVEIKAGGESLALARLRLSAQNLRPRQECEAQCDFILEHSGVSGNFAFRGAARYYAPNITFRDAALSFTATEPPELSRLSPMQCQFDGALDLEGERLRIQKITVQMPGVELAGLGVASVNLKNGFLKSDFMVKTGDLEFPVSFEGSFEDLGRLAGLGQKSLD